MDLLRLLIFHVSALYCLPELVLAVSTHSESLTTPSPSAILFVDTQSEGQHPFPLAVGLRGSGEVVDEEEKEKAGEDGDVWTTVIMDQGSESPNNTEVVAQVGGDATFTCFTEHLNDDVVTWLRREDDQLLTVGQQLYASEDRFTATHSPHNKAWELWVKDVQLSDAGLYECQLTTHPPVTFYFTLKVTQAMAVVGGPPEVHIEEGSKLALECEVHRATSPPVYIFWYHNSTMVNYARHHYLQVQHQNYTSSLVVARVTPSDAGTYTCEPHLATPANVTVHVVTGKTPAAMQHGVNHVGRGSVTCPPPSFSVVAVSLLVCVLLPQSHRHHRLLR